MGSSSTGTSLKLGHVLCDYGHTMTLTEIVTAVGEGRRRQVDHLRRCLPDKSIQGEMEKWTTKLFENKLCGSRTPQFILELAEEKVNQKPTTGFFR